jgi:hypothetical protein
MHGRGARIRYHHVRMQGAELLKESTARGAPPNGYLVIIFGVLLPACFVILEYTFGLFGFFALQVARPLPLALFAGLVPVINAITSWRTHALEAWRVRLAGMALGISAFYAVISLPAVLLGIHAMRVWSVALILSIPVAAFLVCRGMSRFLADRRVDGELLLRQGFVFALLAFAASSGSNIAVATGLILAKSGYFHENGIMLLRFGGNRLDLMRAGSSGCGSIADFWTFPIRLRAPGSQSLARLAYQEATGRRYEAQTGVCLDSEWWVPPPRN